MKKKKRKKLRVKNLFKFLLIILIILLIGYLVMLLKVKTFYIDGNKYLTDEEVLKELKLNSNSPFVFTNNIFEKNIIKKSNYIKSVSLSKNFDLEIFITVEEYRMLFLDQNDNKIVLENEKRIDYTDINLPVLVNKIDNKSIYSSFVKKMSKVDDNTLTMISEINYSPNGIDKERFIFSMNDGNYVYVTLTKLKKINEYRSIIDSVENKKGILYLDYGNYFVPKE